MPRVLNLDDSDKLYVMQIAQTIFLLVVLTGTAAGAPQPLAVRIQTSPASAGGLAQIQLFLNEPHALVSGSISADLDPQIFGDIVSANVFGAIGDQSGVASLSGRHIDLTFTSPYGGVGRLPGMPIITIEVPALVTLDFRAGVTVKTGPQAWLDFAGTTYTPTPNNIVRIVSAPLTLSDVTPGGGPLPEGSIVTLAGNGFTPATVVEILGVPVRSQQVISSQQMTVTLGAVADLTGKLVTVRNADGSTASRYSWLRPVYALKPSTGALATLQPIFPQQGQTNGTMGNFFLPGTTAICFQNRNAVPVDVLLQEDHVAIIVPPPTKSTITIPPGQVYVRDGNSVPGSELRSTLSAFSSLPLQMLIATAQPLRVRVPPFTQPASSAITTHPASLSFTVQAGGSLSSSEAFQVNLYDTPQTVTVSSLTAAGGAWLAVTPARAQTCIYSSLPLPGGNCPIGTVTATIDPSHMSPGTFNGTITITPDSSSLPIVTVPVTVIALAHTVLTVPSGIALSLNQGASEPPAILKVAASSPGVTLSATAAVEAGGSWLTVSPASVIAGVDGSAAFTYAVNSSGLAPGDYKGAITIQAPDSSTTVPVSLTVSSPSTSLSPVVPTSLTFYSGPGTGTLPPRYVDVQFAYQPFTASVTSDKNWLSIFVNTIGVPRIAVTADSKGLAPGTYQGVVTVLSSAQPNPIPVPVTLAISADNGPALSVAPTSLSFAAVTGDATAPPQPVSISTGTISEPYTVTVTTADGGSWLGVGSALGNPQYTPVDLLVGASASALLPGTYNGAITITTASGTVFVPVSFVVTPAVPPPPAPGAPLIANIVNSASAVTGSIAPQEIITLFGTNVNGAQILFDGAPVTPFYASPTQVNLAVPASVAGSQFTTIRIVNRDLTSQSAGVTVTSRQPGIFTLDGSGYGNAAVLNQDNSVNGPASAASRGSVIQIFGTGAGIDPANVTVSIGGLDAPVRFAGRAPGAVTGLFQVNAIVPTALSIGATVPISITVDGVTSPAGPVIAVQ